MNDIFKREREKVRERKVGRLIGLWLTDLFYSLQLIYLQHSDVKLLLKSTNECYQLMKLM